MGLMSVLSTEKLEECSSLNWEGYGNDRLGRQEGEYLSCVLDIPAFKMSPVGVRCTVMCQSSLEERPRLELASGVVLALQ